MVTDCRIPSLSNRNGQLCIPILPAKRLRRGVSSWAPATKQVIYKYQHLRQMLAIQAKVSFRFIEQRADCYRSQHFTQDPTAHHCHCAISRLEVLPGLHLMLFAEWFCGLKAQARSPHPPWHMYACVLNWRVVWPLSFDCWAIPQTALCRKEERSVDF